MAGDIDDTTAAQVGHALVRWVTDEDPGGVARFAPGIDPTTVDDAKAARIGHVLADLLANLDNA
jgi:hypothetical protein